MSGAPVRAVTFDYWNTIVRTHADPSAWRLDQWQALLGGAGHDVPTELVRAVFDAEWLEHQAAWQRNEQYTGVRAAQGAVARLGLDLPAGLVDALVEAFQAAGEDVPYELCPGVADALTALAERGVGLGIICDVGFTPSVILRRLLEGFGVLDVFTGWSFSDEVGWYKPAGEIFRHALGYLGEPADACAHIGDLRRTDIAGARAMGMRSIRYAGVNDDDTAGPEADVVVTDYADLLDALGH